MKSFHIKSIGGFTLVELLAVIAIIGILAGIVLTSISNTQVKSRNAQRSTAIATILDAVYQYALDNNNQLPATITTATTSICRTGAVSCTGLIDLSVLTNSQKYLVSIPTDPLSTSTTDTGYEIFKNANNRVTVYAPSAEGSTTISIIR
jgi:prepilin-type N-terminal cleavage/methylation domain-containing protein